MEKNPAIPNQLIKDIRSIIEKGKLQAVKQVNHTLNQVYWQVGKRINEVVLQNERAEYGKHIVEDLAVELTKQYGRAFVARNLRRMMQFATVFSDWEIVSPVVTQLSWTHFIILLPLKSQEARLYYAHKAIEGQWSKRELTRQIERKAFERNEIADNLFVQEDIPQRTVFKDPYLLDFLDLHAGYSENDLEAAILRDLEEFILELGIGFTFVERQKRMILDGVDFYLDLLFYHRKLKRLVAIELKLDKFKPA